MKPWTLTAKLVATGVVFLTLALLSIGLTLWVSWNLEGGAAAVNEAGRLRMLTYRVALGLPVQGAPTPEARHRADAFDASLSLLRSGDPARPLFVPWSATARERFEQVDAGWRDLRGRWFDATATRLDALPQADAFVRQIDGFVDAIEQSLARWTAVLHAFQLTMLGLAIASVVAMLYAAYRLVLHPLARIGRGLAAIQHGDLSARIEPSDPRDEFGQIAAGFNAMAQTLKSLYAGLEQRVRDKTARLEEQRRRLSGLYEVSAFVARATSLDELAQGFARRVRRIARADAAAVRWCDEANHHYVLLGSDRLPAAFRDDEACLDTGACHCGQATAGASTRIIPIHAAEPAPLDHCARAGYRTVLSVPVRLQDRTLGEVSLFYAAERTLGVAERGLLDTLARHLASAMENLRTAALEREAAVAEERSLLARELHDSIAQSLAFMKIQMQLLSIARQRGDEPATTTAIGELETGVQECHADVRELLMHFRTRTRDEDIGGALRSTLQKFEHQTGLPARLEIDGHGVALAPDVQVQALHIVQEALSNVRKHARATEVVLKVQAAPRWRFEVCDNGVGFDPVAGAPDETHVGLRIMRERAARIGASVRVSAQPGGGCRVTLELPAPGAAPTAAAPRTPDIRLEDAHL